MIDSTAEAASINDRYSMRLQHVWASRGIYHFDQQSGLVGPKVDVNRNAADWGFVWKERGRWYVLRKDQNGLIFQCGEKTWHLTENVAMRTSRGVFRRFEISRDGKVEFTVRYPFRGWVHAIIDPAYGALDEESDDFFLYVAETWTHWAGRDFSLFLRA
ncbi:MAG: hypothetical protein JO142_09585 [Burkholderiales bacterium]|nr:hypothetical protein [Burkholderiales bacterium]